MAIKPVLSVDVDDAKFKSFLDKFKKYQEALKDQPEIWKKTNEELSDTEQLTTTLTGLFYTQNEILEKNVDAHRKVRGELGKDRPLHGHIWAQHAKGLRDNPEYNRVSIEMVNRIERAGASLGGRRVLRV